MSILFLYSQFLFSNWIVNLNWMRQGFEVICKTFPFNSKVDVILLPDNYWGMLYFGFVFCLNLFTWKCSWQSGPWDLKKNKHTHRTTKCCFLRGVSFSLFFEWKSLLLIKISSSFGKCWRFWSLPKGKGSLGGFLVFFFDSYLQPLSLPLCASNPTFVLRVFELDLSTAENGGWKWTQIRLFWVEAEETDYFGTRSISHSSQGSGERLSFCTFRQLEPCFSQVHEIINICKTIVFVGLFL